MYGPAPPRPKKTNFRRSRAGCEPCRSIKKKCDEGKPTCQRCETKGTVCSYGSAPFQFRDANFWAAQKVKQVRGDRAHIASPQLIQNSFPLNESPGATGREVADPLLESQLQARQSAPNQEPTQMSYVKKTQWTVGKTDKQTFGYRALQPSPRLFGGSREELYMTHFASHVCDILPPSLEAVSTAAKGKSVLQNAAMAIGAANLANLQGSYTRHQSTGPQLWIPDPRHRLDALNYAGKALSLARRGQLIGVDVLVSAHLLLSFVELELGTFDGLHRYLSSLDDLIYQTRDKLLDCEKGQDLLVAAVHARTTQRYIVGPWSTSTAPSEKENFWLGLERQVLSDSASFQKAGSDAYLLIQRIRLITTMQHNRTSPSPVMEALIKQLLPLIAPNLVSHHGEQPSELSLTQAHEQSLAELRHLARMVSVLKPTSDFLSQPDHLAEPEAIRLESYEHAMHAADYAFFQILCDETIVQSLAQPPNSCTLATDGQAAHWLQVLMSIARGLDIAKCAHRNMYRRGICSMLFLAGLLCRDIGVFDLLEEVLDKILARGSGWEDVTFPTLLARPMIQVVRDQLKLERVILLASTMTQDFDKSCTIVSNRLSQVLLVHGIEANGKLFDDAVPLGDG
ncbi:hypothetical protein B0J15DRAFT_444474 [Fusarium solani]|uniref:Zn(2)-C6 fungal-type domain-containing protein n=1 Tax=Fusarium solani TaxID=169388 RepID=A0A9P9KET9_FUSSL|nr:uncharacterized protein B0J15DRAFT_444474 [Fusarium solani]KAH7260007.1 hypothetical protein B0J15DRAFT_444474 [Fusarium solani]